MVFKWNFRECIPFAFQHSDLIESVVMESHQFDCLRKILVKSRWILCFFDLCTVLRTAPLILISIEKIPNNKTKSPQFKSSDFQKRKQTRNNQMNWRFIRSNYQTRLELRMSIKLKILDKFYSARREAMTIKTLWQSEYMQCNKKKKTPKQI